MKNEVSQTETEIKSCSITQVMKPESNRVPANTRVKLTDVVVTARVEEGIFVQQKDAQSYGGIFILAPMGGRMLKPGNHLNITGVVKGNIQTRWIEPESINISKKNEEPAISPIEITARKSLDPYSGMLVKLHSDHTAFALNIDTADGLEGVLDTRLGDFMLNLLVN